MFSSIETMLTKCREEYFVCNNETLTSGSTAWPALPAAAADARSYGATANHTDSAADFKQQYQQLQQRHQQQQQLRA